MAVIQQNLTLEEFLKLPEEKPALEFVEGMVRQKVSPKGKHSKLQAQFIQRINGFGPPRQLAEAFPELRATFFGASPVPNVSVYRWDRIPLDDKGQIANDFLEPPDITIEIVRRSKASIP